LRFCDFKEPIYTFIKNDGYRREIGSSLKAEEHGVGLLSTALSPGAPAGWASTQAYMELKVEP
jgi:hypothetical protein